jgi:hypothetical protein
MFVVFKIYYPYRFVHVPTEQFSLILLYDISHLPEAIGTEKDPIDEFKLSRVLIWNFEVL